MEKISPKLMDFIDAEDYFEKILVVESSAYIEKLRERFPLAKIFFVTSDEDDAEKFSSVAQTFLLEYREERLPFKEEFFDAIISDLTLEVVINPQDIAAGFSKFIKQTGFFLTSFRNLRHWKVLKKIMHGHYDGIVSRLYTRKDFERLFYASFYKEVRFLPIIKKSPPEMLKKLIECGFENYGDDLETEFWLVRAARSMTELAMLKSMYTPEVRAEFSRIIHRIEYDIETEESVKRFFEIYDEVGMFEEYAKNFIEEVVIHKENFYKNLNAFKEH
ncbi:MAG: hypothetical protein IKZ58_08930 [Selenomonadaceae bacterium]|nr:hypothetical protein [Selenomonadaceae bacterium]